MAFLEYTPVSHSSSYHNFRFNFLRYVNSKNKKIEKNIDFLQIVIPLSYPCTTNMIFLKKICHNVKEMEDKEEII